ncbi:Co/Zn/Cd transporter [Hamiltosporidium tvaerminnensis]|uniref:Co/Zn/Cd transporter n=1 Tax=Hamiltosporidium tvaerminnensis TaxID=1176355 RepID=A0A4V2JUW0_9MICR|nr:Co/Zn/Cd transporter [Hamiltosporidium tvaerminnensis]
MFCKNICTPTTDKTACRTNSDIKKLIKVLTVVLLFMSLEIWGHWYTNSLSLLADSMHLFVDILGFLVSLMALKWTKKTPNSTFSFGYYRMEILGALFSILFIWGTTGYLIIESYNRYVNPPKINGKIFFFISVIGFFVNIFCVYFLHEKNTAENSYHRNLNIRAAYVHVIGDMIQSIGVILASIITVLYPNFHIVDVFCTMIFSILVLSTTGLIIKDALLILLETTPKDVKIEDLKRDILSLENVHEIIDLHCWSISTNIKAITCHIFVSEILPWQYDSLLKKIKSLLKDVYGFDFSTVQFETQNTRINPTVFSIGGTTIFSPQNSKFYESQI